MSDNSSPPELQSTDVKSISDLLERLKKDTEHWNRSGDCQPWFRGVTDVHEHELIPSVLRDDDHKRHEFNITTRFRLLAPGFGVTLDTNRLDQWLFLMQHHRCPTRLLDWTESCLVAAFFATEKAAEKPDTLADAAIYAIDPFELNTYSTGLPEFPNTWVQGPTLQTIKFAFGTEKERVLRRGKPVRPHSSPVAIYPSIVHNRLAAQGSCFTLHGSDPRHMVAQLQHTNLLKSRRLIRYVVRAEHISSMHRELHELGLGFGKIYADLDGLAKELKYSFGSA